MSFFIDETELKEAEAVRRLKKCWNTLVKNFGILAITRDVFVAYVEDMDLLFSAEYAYIIPTVYDAFEKQYLEDLLDMSKYHGQQRVTGLLTVALKRYMEVNTCENRSHVGFCNFADDFFNQNRITLVWKLLCFQHRDDFFRAHMNDVYFCEPKTSTMWYHSQYFQDATEPLSSFDIEN